MQDVQKVHQREGETTETDTLGLQTVANQAEDETTQRDTFIWPKVSNRSTTMQQMRSSIQGCLLDEQSTDNTSIKAG